MQCVGHSTLHDTASTCSIEEPSYSATVYRHTSFRVSGHTVSLRCRVFEGVQRPVHCKSWMLAGFVSAEKTRSRCASVRVSSSISYARRAWHSFNFPCQVRQRGEKGGMNRQQRQEDGSRTAWDTLLLYTMGPVGSYVKSQEICARGESNASFPGTRSRCAAAHGLHSFMSYMYIFAYTYIYIYSRVLYAPHIICIQLCRQIFLQQDGSGPFLGKPLLAFILECLNPASTLRSISAVLLNHVRKCWPC